MRSIVALAAAVLSATSSLACEITPQANVKLDQKDQAVLLSSLGKAIKAPELLNGAPVAALFSEPAGVLTLDAPNAQALSKALLGLPKATACNADRVTMERILEDDTPGIRFLKQIEGLSSRRLRRQSVGAPAAARVFWDRGRGGTSRPARRGGHSPGLSHPANPYGKRRIRPDGAFGRVLRRSLIVTFAARRTLQAARLRVPWAR